MAPGNPGNPVMLLNWQRAWRASVDALLCLTSPAPRCSLPRSRGEPAVEAQTLLRTPKPWALGSCWGWFAPAKPRCAADKAACSRSRARRQVIRFVTAFALSIWCIRLLSSVLLNLSFPGEFFHSVAISSVPSHGGSPAASSVEVLLILLRKSCTREDKCSPANTSQPFPLDVAHMP